MSGCGCGSDCGGGLSSYGGESSWDSGGGDSTDYLKEKSDRARTRNTIGLLVWPGVTFVLFALAAVLGNGGLVIIAIVWLLIGPLFAAMISSAL